MLQCKLKLIVVHLKFEFKSSKTYIRNMITLIIVAITAITSIRGFNNSLVINEMIFAPEYMHRNREWHRFFSHGLIHADWMHLIFNMLALYSFGVMVEDTFVELYDAKG